MKCDLLHDYVFQGPKYQTHKNKEHSQSKPQQKQNLQIHINNMTELFMKNKRHKNDTCDLIS